MADVALQSIFDEARRALDAGDADRAVGIARHILQHAPEAIEAHHLLGEAYLNAGQTEQALAAFETVLRADPENVPAYYGLGLAQQSLRRPGEAIHAFERALEIQPNLAELRSQLLRLYSETPGSAAQFRLSRAGLGRLYARGQMYGQAIDEFRAVLDAEPDRDDIRVALAETLWRDGDEDEAADWCRDALQSQPDLHKPTLILGYLRLAAGQPDGEALWRRAAAQDPSLQAAHSLFDILPPIHVEEPAIPAFDERAWREEQGRIPPAQPVEEAPVAAGGDAAFDQPAAGSAAATAAAAIPAQDVVAPPPAVIPAEDVGVPPPAATPAEDVAAPPPAATAPVAADTPYVEETGGTRVSAPDDSLSDDALLASLLGFDDEGDVDLVDSETAEPSRLHAAESTAPASLDEIGMPDESIDADRRARTRSFSFDDLDVVENHAGQGEQDQQFDDSVRPARPFSFDNDLDNPAPQPFDLDDIGGSAQPFRFEDRRRGEEGDDLGSVQPFSLDNWNFESTDERLTGTITQDPAQADRPADSTPFSLAALTPEAPEQDREEQTVGPRESEDNSPIGGGPTAAATHETSPSTGFDDDDADGEFFSVDEVSPVDAEDTREDETLPFSLSELGLADQDAVAVNRSSAAGDEPAAQAASQDFEPFSLRELGLDAVGPTADAPVGTGTEDDAEHFALVDLGLDDQSVRAGQEGDESIDDVTRFSFADFGLEENDVAAPPGDQPRSGVSNGQVAGENGSVRQPGSLAEPARDDQTGQDWASITTPGGEPDARIEEETTPFSLADLGLTDEELARLGLEDTTGTPEGEGPPVSYGVETGNAADEEITPFSLADLGLSDEELEAFTVEADERPPEAGGEDAGVESAADAAPRPFSVVHQGPDEDELAAGSVGDVDPQDIFVTDRDIHDADTTPFPVVSSVPEPSAAPVTSEEPVRLAEIGDGGAMFPSDDGDPPPDLPPVPAELSRFYQQLEAQPDNHAMRLALARMSEQRGDRDRALEQYRQLIRQAALLEPVVEDLRELAGNEGDGALQRRLHRLLGDAYMKQERFEEAMDEYSRT